MPVIVWSLLVGKFRLKARLERAARMLTPYPATFVLGLMNPFVFVWISLSLATACGSAWAQQLKWRNRALSADSTISTEAYLAKFQAAKDYCEQNIDRRPLPWSDCRGAMQSGSIAAANLCRETHVDCTDALSSGSIAVADECTRYAYQVRDKRKQDPNLMFMSCMSQKGWEYVSLAQPN